MTFTPDVGYTGPASFDPHPVKKSLPTYVLINNGLFRQYFPKGSDLSILSDADVQRVVLTTFHLSEQTYGLNQLRYVLRKLKTD